MRFYGKKEGLSGKMKKELAPDRQFAERAKKDFLAFFDVKQSSRPAGAVFLSEKEGVAGLGARVRYAWWGTGAVVAALGLVAATSAFADVANVAPSNPLYPLKRLAENVQLTFAGTAQKPVLELAFAARRAQEIDAIAAQPDPAAHKALIKSLKDDFNNEVSSSLAAAAHARGNGDSLAGFCGSLAAIATSSTGTASENILGIDIGPVRASIVGRIAANPAFVARVASECGLALPSTTMEEAAVADASSTASSSAADEGGNITAASSTLGDIRSEGNGRVRGGGRDAHESAGGDGDASTTTSVEIGVSVPSLPALLHLHAVPGTDDAPSASSTSSSSPSSSSSASGSDQVEIAIPVPSAAPSAPVITSSGASGGSGSTGGGSGVGASVGVSLPSVSL